MHELSKTMAASNTGTRKETPQDRYLKAHAMNVNIRVMKHTEQDIIQKLNSVPNKAGYIKSLIRADIRRELEEAEEQPTQGRQ